MPFPPLKVLCREWIVEGRRRVWTVAKERSEVWHSEKERQGDSVANLFEKRLIVSFSDSGRLDRDRDPYWQEATRWAHRRRCHWETFLCQPEVRVELLSSKVFGGHKRKLGTDWITAVRIEWVVKVGDKQFSPLPTHLPHSTCICSANYFPKKVNPKCPPSVVAIINNNNNSISNNNCWGISCSSVRDDIEQLKIFLIGSGAAHPAKRCVINQNF